MNFPKSAEVHADCFGFREFKTVSIHPVLQLIQCLLKMSLNDVNKLGTIAYEEVVHAKRAFDTGGYTFNDRVNFLCKECNREYAASWSNTSEICEPNLI